MLTLSDGVEHDCPGSESRNAGVTDEEVSRSISAAMAESYRNHHPAGKMTL